MKKKFYFAKPVPSKREILEFDNKLLIVISHRARFSSIMLLTTSASALLYFNMLHPI